MQPLLTVSHALAGVWFTLALGMLPALAWSAVARDGLRDAFLIPMVAAMLGATVLWLATRGEGGELRAREACLLLVLGWSGAAAIGCLPLLLGVPGLSVTDAYFDSMAALTTTASSALASVEALAPSLRLWRHLQQWYGGLAVIVMAVTILPMLGVGGMQMARAETPGPMKEGRLINRTWQTMRRLGLLYLSATAVCLLMLHWAGMGGFDALCHALSTLSLGGFSTRDAGIADWDSPYVEGILIAFMMFAALNFSTHWLALRKRSIDGYLRDSETLASWLLVLVSAFMLAGYLVGVDVYQDYWASLRRTAFATVSMATSAGFVGEDHGVWPTFVGVWLLALCAVASTAGSTGGGIRMFRALIMVKQTRRELVRLIHPKVITPMRIGGHAVENRLIFAVLGYMLLFGTTVVVLSFALMGTGLDFLSAFSGVVSSMSNTGPGLSALAPGIGYRAMTDAQTWLFTLAMLAGRVELFALFVIVTPQFWRK